jgi:hypothetical protein
MPDFGSFEVSVRFQDWQSDDEREESDVCMCELLSNPKGASYAFSKLLKPLVQI